VVYATAGAGHRRAAEALQQAAAESFPDADIRCVDALDFTPGWFRCGYEWTYLLLVRRFPWIWRVSYRWLDGVPGFAIVQPLRKLWNVLIAYRFIRWLQAWRPHVIAVTHFLPADVCSTAKRLAWLEVPLVVVVTDLHPHRFWLSPQCDAVVVSTEEGEAVCVRRGVPRPVIHRLGIPVSTAFGATRDRAAVQQQHGLAPQRVTVLVTSGGTTVGQFEHVVERLVALDAMWPQRLQLLVVCGEDAAARHRLEAVSRSSPVPMRVFGFIDTMAECMAASDLIVAKAGGLTVTEALGSGRPLILYHVIPGQERMNADYVSRTGAGMIAQRPSDVGRAVARLLAHPEQLEAMRQKAQALGRPDAARAIISTVMKPLVQHGGS